MHASGGDSPGEPHEGILGTLGRRAIRSASRPFRPVPPLSCRRPVVLGLHAWVPFRGDSRVPPRHAADAHPATWPRGAASCWWKGGGSGRPITHRRAVQARVVQARAQETDKKTAAGRTGLMVLGGTRMGEDGLCEPGCWATHGSSPRGRGRLGSAVEPGVVARRGAAGRGAGSAADRCCCAKHRSGCSGQMQVLLGWCPWLIPHGSGRR
jgi:hypothetical protein